MFYSFLHLYVVSQRDVNQTLCLQKPVTGHSSVSEKPLPQTSILLLLNSFLYDPLINP
jgi:hypothetical protein